jgi:REP element-mobilizing transposase RayT
MPLTHFEKGKYVTRRYINKPARLRKYNYDTPGAYFVTVCSKDRRDFFGEIENGEMALNPLGEIAKKCWLEIQVHFANVEMSEYVVMPNHVHGIILMFDNFFDTENSEKPSQRHAFDLRDKRMHEKLPIIIGSYKSAVSRLIMISESCAEFNWQTSYFDHIIRNERAFANIADYVKLNPSKWNEDLENKKHLEKMSEKDRKKLSKAFYIGLTKV